VMIPTLRAWVFAAIALAGGCSIGCAQNWKIGGLTGYLNSELPGGGQYQITGNPCTTEVSGFEFQWLFPVGATCTDSCNPDQTGYYPEASLERRMPV